MHLRVIAYARNGHTDKFGIPRQSREESPILTRIVFEPDFAVPEALRGIEGFSHLWLIWGFNQGERLQEKGEKGDWSPTVRPPRLGGNKRMGVFATRSPFRPNPIGLSSVKLIDVRRTDVRCTEEGQSTKDFRLELLVSGADLLDGTPIYDIKPYLSFSDSHPEALNGFAEETKDYHLDVDWSQIETTTKPQQNHDHTTLVIQREMEYILSQDPRPAYQNDPEREYKIDYNGFTITFCVKETTVIVKKIEKTGKPSSF